MHDGDGFAEGLVEVLRFSVSRDYPVANFRHIELHIYKYGDPGMFL